LDSTLQTIDRFIHSPVLKLAWYLLWFSVVVLWLSLVFWTLKDGRKRIEDNLIVVVAVLTSLVFPFIGTLVYFILRPAEYLSDVRERELEMRAMELELMTVRSCPNCREPVREDYVVCPKCRKALRTACPSCSRPLEYSWKICPYCGYEPAGRRVASPRDQAPGVVGSTS